VPGIASLQIVTAFVPLLALLTAMHVGLLLGGNWLNERKGCTTGLDYGTEHPAWLHAAFKALHSPRAPATYPVQTTSPATPSPPDHSTAGGKPDNRQPIILDHGGDPWPACDIAASAISSAFAYSEHERLDAGWKQPEMEPSMSDNCILFDTQHQPADVPCGTRLRDLVLPNSGIPK
jgi:hypothetical protein